MKGGLRWVIGDGKSINIMGDRWLRGKDSFCVDPGGTCNPESKVCDFFLEGRKEWDETKVRSTFNSSDAEAILSTRIPQRSTQDRVAWVHAKDGQYSVKSGYYQWQLTHVGDVEVQQSEGWRKLWRLKVSHKVKMFLWRVCRNTVPVRYRLRGKGIQVPIGCVMCIGDIEHLMHLLLDCAFTKECWQCMGLDYNTWEVEDVSSWLLDKFCNEPEEILVKIAIVMWGVWWARNKRVWENKVVPAEIAMNWSSNQVVEWRKAQEKRRDSIRSLGRNSGQCSKKWKAPSAGNLSLNVDASVFDGAGYFSIGMLIRDHQGQFVRGRTMKFAGRVSVLEAESVGILEALKWLGELPEQVTTVESDSLLSVQALHKVNQNRTELGDIIDHCRALLEVKRDVSVVFIQKHANRVAHLLARLSCTLNSFVDYSSPPSCVLETLLSDV